MFRFSRPRDYVPRSCLCERPEVMAGLASSSIVPSGLGQPLHPAPRRCPRPRPRPRPGVLGEVRRAPGPPQGRRGSPAAPPLCRWDRTGSMSCSFLFLSVAGLHSSLAPLTNEICRWRLRTGGNFSLCSNTSFVRRCFLSYNSCNVRIWI